MREFFPSFGQYQGLPCGVPSPPTATHRSLHHSHLPGCSPVFSPFLSIRGFGVGPSPLPDTQGFLSTKLIQWGLGLSLWGSADKTLRWALLSGQRPWGGHLAHSFPLLSQARLSRDFLLGGSLPPSLGNLPFFLSWAFFLCLSSLLGRGPSLYSPPPDKADL